MYSLSLWKTPSKKSRRVGYLGRLCEQVWADPGTLGYASNASGLWKTLPWIHLLHRLPQNAEVGLGDWWASQITHSGPRAQVTISLYFFLRVYFFQFQRECGVLSKYQYQLGISPQASSHNMDSYSSLHKTPCLWHIFIVALFGTTKNSVWKKQICLAYSPVKLSIDNSVYTRTAAWKRGKI